MLLDLISVFFDPPGVSKEAGDVWIYRPLGTCGGGRLLPSKAAAEEIERELTQGYKLGFSIFGIALLLWMLVSTTIALAGFSLSIATWLLYPLWIGQRYPRYQSTGLGRALEGLLVTGFLIALIIGILLTR